MSKPPRNLHPSLDGSDSLNGGIRPSLFQTKDIFIERIAPIATAAIYFGGFSLSPQDSSLSRQALFKLSFLHRHFLHPRGLRVAVEDSTAILAGSVASPQLNTLAKILASQIEGIRKVKDTTRAAGVDAAVLSDQESIRESIQFLFATDQTLRSGLQVRVHEGHLVLEGEVTSAAQKNWAEQLAGHTGGWIESQLTIGNAAPSTTASANEPPQVDDESLQALILFRLRLVRETEHLSLKVKAVRGVVTLHGKVRTEALRQSVENLSRSALGVRELRSSLSVTE